MRRRMMMGKDGPKWWENYLTVRALVDDFDLFFSGSDLEYCIHSEGVWKTLPNQILTPSISQGDAISFRARIKPTSYNGGCGFFTIAKACNLEGNCMSLLFGDYAAGETDLSAFKTGVFGYMFNSCTGIRMVASGFLPATVLSYYCYTAMFEGCSNLLQAPELPATELASCCYYAMFRKCSSLVFAPVLPALTLVSKCYEYLFYYCSSLNYIKAMFLTAPTYLYVNYWTLGLASSGTFVRNPEATWDIGSSSMPAGWTIVTE